MEQNPSVSTIKNNNKEMNKSIDKIIGIDMLLYNIVEKQGFREFFHTQKKVG